MKFEWDEQKRQNNIRKHGVDFARCLHVFAETTVTMVDDRSNYGEERFVTMGLLDGRVVVIVHTETSTTIRLISARKATRREEFLFYKSLDN